MLYKKHIFCAVFAALLGGMLHKGHAAPMPQGQPVPPPMGYLRFCLLNPADCRPAVGQPERITLSVGQIRQLQAVQTTVNRDVRPRPDAGRLRDDWTYPARGAGDCEDYALEKRKALIGAGWPASVLRLATAVTEKGEPHVVLTVATTQGDWVLDNRYHGIQPWSSLKYRWLARQDTRNPLKWAAATAPATQMAGLSTYR